VQQLAHLHKIIYLLPALGTAVLLAVGVAAALRDAWAAAGIVLALAALPLAWAHIIYTSSEFAVTDKRVIIKVGVVRRRTLETMLGKVEGIGVDQTVMGRLLGFGTITVTGTGGTTETFANIADPLDFRRHVQAQVIAAEEARRAVTHASVSGYEPVREERDCPFCAERILVRARVCKHCGREVGPA
jgi:uncharacterized membrane protein YdbT with pleckstrin-like domain